MALVPKDELVHQCRRCRRRYPHGFTPRCNACGGLVEVQYDLGAARLHDSPVVMERYFDLLPIREPDSLLPLGEGNTPCVHAAVLGAVLGLERVYLKVESHNPTGTTKDRMAAVVLSLFNELGIAEFVSSSTGNTANSLAYGIRRYPRFTMHLFVGAAFQDGLRFAYDNPGIVLNVLEGMAYAEVSNYAQGEATRRRLPFEAGFFNPARREGLKLAYFEAAEQIPDEIRWYVQAVSSAMGAYGTWKGAKELQALGLVHVLPRIVCVQQESCCPMVRAFEEGSPVIKARHVVPNASGIARAILLGDPSDCYPYVYEMVQESGGTFVRVSEGEIREAQARLVETERIHCGYAAAATAAALVKLVDRGSIRADETVLLNLTD
jgi:threonine synthase